MSLNLCFVLSKHIFCLSFIENKTAGSIRVMSNRAFMARIETNKTTDVTTVFQIYTTSPAEDSTSTWTKYNEPGVRNNWPGFYNFSSYSYTYIFLCKSQVQAICSRNILGKTMKSSSLSLREKPSNCIFADFTWTWMEWMH